MHRSEEMRAELLLEFMQKMHRSEDGPIYSEVHPASALHKSGLFL
jgi:hypothetical protein